MPRVPERCLLWPNYLKARHTLKVTSIEGRHGAAAFESCGSDDDIVGLRRDGSVVAWGDDHSGETQVPPGLKDVRSIVAGPTRSLAIHQEGSMVVWGSVVQTGQITPAGLDELAAAEFGSIHAVALVGPLAKRGLTVTKSSPGAVLWWPTGPVLHRLQSTGIPSASDWTLLPDPPPAVPGWNKLVMETDSTARSYRLVQP